MLPAADLTSNSSVHEPLSDPEHEDPEVGLVPEEPQLPRVRLALSILGVLTLGSLAAYSVWSYRLKACFPAWTAQDLGLVYSCGLFGSWSYPVGGFLYDRLGSRVTKVFGVASVALGLVTMAALTSVPSCPPLAFALVYLFEEHGAASLMVAITCDVMHFAPPSVSALAMGMVTAAYAGSSVLWVQALGAPELTLAPQLFAMLAVVVSVCLPLAAYPNPVVAGAEKPGLGAYGQCCRSRSFFALASIAVLLRAPNWMMTGVLRERGDASGLDGKGLATLCLALNTLVRVPVGYLYDKYATKRTNYYANLCLSVAFSVGAAVLSFEALHPSGALVALGACTCMGAFGLAAPLANVWVRESFPQSVRGGVMGLHAISVSLGNLTVQAALGPSATQAPGDFFGMSAGVLVLGSVLVVTLALCGPPSAVLPLGKDLGEARALPPLPQATPAEERAVAQRA